MSIRDSGYAPIVILVMLRPWLYCYNEYKDPPMVCIIDFEYSLELDI